MKVFNIIKKIFLSRLIFTNPKSKEILFWGRSGHVKIFQKKNKLLNYKSIHFLDVWGESYYLSILIKCFFKLKFTLKDYSEEFIKLIKPKLIISFLDNYQSFYLIKKKKDQKKILIQNAFRCNEFNTFTQNSSYLNKNNKVDYVFAFNENIKKKYQTMLGSKTIVIGSFLSNNVPIKKYKKKFDILYISTLRPDKNFRISENIFLYDYLNAEKKLLKNLLKFATNNDKKLFILTSNKPDQKKEVDTLKKILGKDDSYKILKRNIYDLAERFKIVDKAKIVIGIDSTLLYESFSRGVKTIFCDVRPKNQFLSKTRYFAWPKKFKPSGPFWISKNNYEIINKIIKSVSNYSDKRWKKLKKKYQNSLMIFDKDNKTLKKVLNNQLKN